MSPCYDLRGFGALHSDTGSLGGPRVPHVTLATTVCLPAALPRGGGGRNAPRPSTPTALTLCLALLRFLQQQALSGCEVDTLQKGKLGPWEGPWLTQGPTAEYGQSWDLNPGPLALEHTTRVTSVAAGERAGQQHTVLLGPDPVTASLLQGDSTVG